MPTGASSERSTLAASALLSTSRHSFPMSASPSKGRRPRTSGSVPLLLRPQHVSTMLSWSACIGSCTEYLNGGRTSTDLRPAGLGGDALGPDVSPAAAWRSSTSGGATRLQRSAAASSAAAVSRAVAMASFPDISTTSYCGPEAASKASTACSPFSTTSTISPSASSMPCVSTAVARHSSTSSAQREPGGGEPPQVLARLAVRTAGLSPPAFRYLVMTSISSAFFTGLGTWSSMPTDRQCSRSPAIARALQAMMGVRVRLVAASQARISRVACHPSFTGMSQSMRMMSTSALVACFTPSMPSCASSMEIPAAFSSRAIITRDTLSSSTTRHRMGLAAAQASVAALGATCGRPTAGLEMRAERPQAAFLVRWRLKMAFMFSSLVGLATISLKWPMIRLLEVSSPVAGSSEAVMATTGRVSLG
mmetsp:Transcript_23833/g.61888  ORF Transcript_23833/g.61888 Transcript_23833/m.61888 type:complete len:421 (+) Transcript_23833:1286-2548(+)